MSLSAKLYNKILLLRLRRVLEGHLSKSQNGFRPRRSTTQHILALRIIMEECQHAKDTPLVATFIDFSKAFDTIKWTYLDAILKLYGVPDKLRAAIMSVYYGTTARVRTSDGVSDPFPLTTGVLQGDTLAPYLFIIVLDYIMKTANTRPQDGFPMRSASQRNTTYISDLIYADDIATLTTSREKAEKLLQAIEQAALPTGLKINTDKTEAMHIPLSETPATPIQLSTGPIKWCKDFKYLGSLTATSYEDLKHRLDLAWKAAVSIRRIWKSTLTDKTKVRLFLTLIVTILFYGAETWILTKTQRQRLFNGYNKLLRYTLDIHFTSHTKTAAVYERAGLPKPAHILATRILHFVERLLDGPPQPVRDVLQWTPRHSYIPHYRVQRSYRHMLYNIASQKGTTPLHKLLHHDRVNRIKHLFKDLSDKEFIKRRLREIPFNLSTLEELQKDPLPRRPRSKKQRTSPADTINTPIIEGTASAIDTAMDLA